MGQKTNPIGLRLGVIKGWDSNWFGGKDFSAKLVEDDKIRKYLNARLGKAGISKIAIERSLKYVTVTIFTARPGMIIGKGGEEVDKLKKELLKLTGKEIQININEIKRPELDAYIVASTIAKQIEGRVSYRRAIKTASFGTMRMGAEGIKILIRVVSEVPKSHVPSRTRKVVSRCTRCVPTSTIPWWKPIPLTAVSASRCGSVKVKFMASPSWCPPLSTLLRRRKVAPRVLPDVVPAVVVKANVNDRV